MRPPERHSSRLLDAPLVLLLLTAAWTLSVASASRSRSADDPFTARSIKEPPRRPPPPDASGPDVSGPDVSTRPHYLPCPASPGVILRSQLLRVLDRKPGVFLQGVDVQMVARSQLPGGRHYWKMSADRSRSIFGGWYIRSFHPGDPCMSRSGLRRGDIIADVNGNPLRRPDDMARLWKALRSARRLVVRLYRDGRPLVFVVKIADQVRARSRSRPQAM